MNDFCIRFCKNLILLLITIHSLNLFEKCEGLFEYVCTEQQLFKPYLHVYKGRKGERVTEAGPGFHVMTSEQDIYVCINGPAYLYYAKTTELGQVYEAPQPYVFSHTCEMHNVKPHSKATKIDYELHLMAVLVYGDADDYRRPAIQRFTAPYFFKENDYRVGFPKHYQNATSVAVLGQTECSLEKGDQDPKIPIKFRVTWPAAAGPAPTPAPAPGDKPEPDQFLCRLGFSELLAAATATGATDEAKEQMRAMVNDEPIRVKRCEFTAYNVTDYAKKVASFTERKDAVKKNWQLVDIPTRDKKMEDLIAAAVAPWLAKIAILEKKKAKDPTNPKYDDQIKKITDEKITPENDKLAPFKALTQATEAAVITTLDPATAPVDTPAKDAATALETAITNLKNGEADPATTPAQIITLKDAVYAAETAAHTAAKVLNDGLTTFEMLIANAESLVAQVDSKISNFKPGSGSGKKSKSIHYSERSTPQIIPIDGSAATGAHLCVKLPRLTSNEGECFRGKPAAEHACKLFQITLGKVNPWQDDAGANTTDIWKSEILQLTSAIFTNACPYMSRGRKFVKLIYLALSFYLTSKDHFNKPPPVKGTSMACVAFQNWQKGQPPPDYNNDPGGDGNKVRRPFWDVLVSVLQECKHAKRTLIFVDKSPTYGKWVWIKPGENRTEMTIIPYKEQAEKEYVFNWVIDMTWRIFATAMGMCMPGYENKIPLITSRFYSLFTEDFLIPLRETWVNSKDNLIYQWILGEFYNGDAENWAELCMEASYLYSEREDYRPLRSLLVNCASEHNYFISGKFAGFTSRYVSG